MKNLPLKILPVIFLLSLIVSPAGAQTATDAAVDVIMDTVFSDSEKKVIDDYLKKSGGLPGVEEADSNKKGKGKKNKHGKKGKGKSKQLPPGLAKRKSLPPGLQRQLERRHTLPPGLAVRELPDDLLSRLPDAKKGTDRIVVEDDIVLIEKATGRVLDIILGRGKTK